MANKRLFKPDCCGSIVRTSNGAIPRNFSLTLSVSPSSDSSFVGTEPPCWLDASGTKASTGTFICVDGVVPDFWVFKSRPDRKWVYKLSGIVPRGKVVTWDNISQDATDEDYYLPTVNADMEGTPLALMGPAYAIAPDSYTAVQAYSDASVAPPEPPVEVVDSDVLNPGNLVATASFANGIIASQQFVPLDSPSFTNGLIVPTPPLGDDSDTIANTTFVMRANRERLAKQGILPIMDAQLTGHPTIPDADDDGAEGQILNARTATRRMDTALTQLAGANNNFTLKNATWVQSSAPNPQDPVTLRGLRAITGSGLDYVPLNSPEFYGKPVYKGFGQSSDEITTASWANTEIDRQLTTGDGVALDPNTLPPTSAAWVETKGTICRRIDEDGEIYYTISWQKASVMTPRLGARVRVNVAAINSVYYGTLAYAYTLACGTAWLVVLDSSPDIRADLFEAAVISLSPLLTAREVSQNFYNWQSTTFSGRVALAKDPPLSDYSNAVVSTNWVSAALEASAHRSISVNGAWGMHVQYQPYDWAGKDGKRVEFVKKPSLLMSPGSVTVGGRSLQHSDYFMVDIAPSTISAAIAKNVCPWLFVYAVAYKEAELKPNILVIAAVSAGLAGVNLKAALQAANVAISRQEYASGTITAARLMCALPVHRAGMQIGTTYVYRSTNADLGKSFSTPIADTIRVTKKVTSKSVTARFQTVMSLWWTSPALYLNSYMFGDFVLNAELSGLYGPLLQSSDGWSGPLSSGDSDLTRLTNGQQADASIIPTLLVESFELASAADQFAKDRLPSQSGGVPMLRGSLMSFPYASLGGDLIHVRDTFSELVSGQLDKRWYGMESGFRACNSFEYIPVGPSNALRVDLDALVGPRSSSQDPVALEVGVFPHGHTMARKEVQL